MQTYKDILSTGTADKNSKCFLDYLNYWWSLVMQLLQRLTQRRQVKDDLLKGLDDFIDPDALNQYFQTHQKALDDGLKNIPSPQDTIENSFIYRVTHAGGDAITHLKKNTILLVRSKLDPTYQKALSVPSDQLFNRLTEKAERETVDICKDWGVKLADLGRIECRNLRQLRHFREINQLDREEPAQYKSRFFIIGLLCFLFVFETIINGNAFADVSENGLVGGWYRAGLLSFINLAVSLLIGYFLLRNSLHISPWRCGPARVASVAMILFLIMFHLLIAHWRGLLETSILKDVAAPSLSDAWKTLFDGQLEITSDFSLFLLLCGIVTGTIAMVKGYWWIDDSYPGFGPVYRTWNESQENYQNAIVEFKTMVQQPNESAVAIMQDAITHAADLEDQYRSVASRYRDIGGQIYSAIVGVCATYREINLKVRTAALPIYMDMYPQLPNNIEVYSEMDERAERINDWTNNAEMLLHDCREKLAYRLNQQFAWIELEFLPYIEGVKSPLSVISDRLLSGSDITEKELHTYESTLSRSNPKFTTPPMDPKAEKSSFQESDIHESPLH